MLDVNDPDFEFNFMDATRDVYHEPVDRALIRTEDVYQTETEIGTVGYSDKLLSVIANYKNSGRPEGYNAQAMVGKAKKGEVAMRLFAVVDPETKTFLHAGFQTRGCLAVTACASVICTMIEGKTFEEALAITKDQVEDELDGVPAENSYTPYYAVEAVRALVGDFYFNQGMTLAQFNETGLCDDSSISCIMCENCSLRSTRIEKLVEGVKPAVIAVPGAAAVKEAVEEAPQETPTEPEPAADEKAEQAEQPQVSAEERERETNNALARVFVDVRKQSSDSHLVTPERWPKLGFVPSFMTDEDLEMCVYDYLDAYQKEHLDEYRRGKETPGSPKAHVKSRYRSATHMVGVPHWFDKPAPKGEDAEPAEAPKPVAASSDAQPAPATESILSEKKKHPAKLVAVEEEGAPEESRDEVFGTLDIPEGYKLVEQDGKYVLVPTDEKSRPKKYVVDPAHIVTLVGKYTYYLYDNTRMTDAYAHWAFLASEHDDIVTFVECIRQESRIYPRPMPATSMENDPFRMSPERVENLWKQIEESSDYPDIKRVQASNGDVYYFSANFLEPSYAQSLAEWDAVERYMNV